MRDTNEKQQRTLCFPIRVERRRTRLSAAVAATNWQAGYAKERTHHPRAVSAKRRHGTTCAQRATSTTTKGNLEGAARPALPFWECLFFSSVNRFGREEDREAMSNNVIRTRTQPDRPQKLAIVSPSLGVRAFPDPLPPAVVDELVERSSLRHRPRHRVERRTEGALELFLRPLRYDVVSAKARTKETAERERGGARGEVGVAARSGELETLRYRSDMIASRRSAHPPVDRIVRDGSHVRKAQIPGLVPFLQPFRVLVWACRAASLLQLCSDTPSASYRRAGSQRVPAPKSKPTGRTDLRVCTNDPRYPLLLAVTLSLIVPTRVYLRRWSSVAAILFTLSSTVSSSLCGMRRRKSASVRRHVAGLNHRVSSSACHGFGNPSRGDTVAKGWGGRATERATEPNVSKQTALYVVRGVHGPSGQASPGPRRFAHFPRLISAPTQPPPTRAA